MAQTSNPLPHDALFGRQFSLIVGDKDGNAKNLSDLRFTFKVTKRYTAYPNEGIIRVYNIGGVYEKYLQDHFTALRLELYAGYKANYGLIFFGDIYQVRKGWDEDGVDTWFEFIAFDGSIAYTKAVLSKSFSKDATTNDVLKSVKQSFEDAIGEPLAVRNDARDLPSFKTSRGFVFSKKTKDVMDDIAKKLGVDWSFQNHILMIVPKNKPIEDEAVVINHTSGLIGMVEQTVKGMELKTLLNPRLKMYGRVHVNNKDIVTARQQSLSAYQSNISYYSTFDADGFYKIIEITHEGDTRGNDWFSSVVAIALNVTNVEAGETSDSDTKENT